MQKEETISVTTIEDVLRAQATINASTPPATPQGPNRHQRRAQMAMNRKQMKKIRKEIKKLKDKK